MINKAKSLRTHSVRPETAKVIYRKTNGPKSGCYKQGITVKNISPLKVKITSVEKFATGYDAAQEIWETAQRIQRCLNRQGFKIAYILYDVVSHDGYKYARIKGLNPETHKCRIVELIFVY